MNEQQNNNEFKPYILDEKKMSEFTAASIVMGILLAVVFGAANAYLGLRVGMTVSASIPAAVISMGVIRVLMRKNSILESNMVQTIEKLQKEGLWVAAADMDGEEARKADLTGPIALLIGSEHKGVGRLVKEKCDRVVKIPMRGNINSLNASVAAGILMYEIMTQRGN